MSIQPIGEQAGIGATAERKRQARVIPGLIAGNIMDWYDFTLVSFLATDIARVISPAGAEASRSSLIFTFAIFGVGFIARPLGALLFGRLGDKSSRRTSLLLTTVLMGLGTCLLAFLPSYASVGYFSPICLLLARLFQGFATGGDWGGSNATMIETAPASRRGFFGGVLQASSALGPLSAAAAINVLTATLAPEEIAAWGWRLPFLVGLALTPIVYLLRFRLREEDRLAAKPDAAASTESRLRSLFIASGLVAVIFSAYNTLYYMPTFTEHYYGLNKHSAAVANTYGVLALAVTILPSAWLSDRLGRRPMLMLGSAGAALLSGPMFLLLARGAHEAWLPLPEIAFGVICGAFAGPFPAMMTELFRSGSRQTNMGVVYSTVGILAGGFLGTISTWLLDSTHQPAAAAAVCTICGVLGFIGLLCAPETAFRPLE